MTDAKDPLKRVRRFYAAVSVEPEAQGFAVRLDGRTPRTPGGAAMVLPTRALAELIAGEWRAQGDAILYAAMPATRLCHTALDVVSQTRALSVEGAARFASSDGLCYFADHPASLVHRQEKMWGPLLDWARDACGLSFERAVGVIHREQPPQTLTRLYAILESLDPFTLAAVSVAASLFGSVILALALKDGRINADEAMAAARLDEMFQEERWGVDAEAASKADAKAVEAVMLERWFAALSR